MTQDVPDLDVERGDSIDHNYSKNAKMHRWIFILLSKVPTL